MQVSFRRVAALVIPLFALVAVPAAQAENGHPAPPTYAADVAPILFQNCAECHRPGEAAPMSLLSYQETRPWAKLIRNVVANRVMPPWHADPSVGHWSNDRRLTDAQIDTVVRWVDAGAPFGNPEAVPDVPDFPEGWKIGEPDMVFEMARDQILPPELEDEYRYVMMPTNLTEDRWVSAVEVRPGNRDVVHHVLLFFAENNPQDIGGSLGGWAPGSPPTLTPEGQAIRLPANSLMIFQMHYHKEPGVEARDRTKIGLKFATEPVKKQWHFESVGTESFSIPPGAANHVIRAEKVLPKDIIMQTIVPHMHYRGRSMKVWAELPSGMTRQIVSVPAYDFNWQTFYEFSDPLALPAGTKLISEAVYDNSANNPFNPDPNAEVTWGLPTTAEMMYAFYIYTEVNEQLNALDPAALQARSPSASERLSTASAR